MKRLSLYLFLILFTLQTPSLADDIMDFEIQGLSLGESLLKIYSKNEIEKFIQNENQVNFYPKSKKYFTLATPSQDKNFNQLNIDLKYLDEKYIIYGVSQYKRLDINECIKEKEKAAKEIKKLFSSSVVEDKYSQKHRGDKSGNSTVHNTEFIFTDGSYISLSCSEWGTEMKEKGYNDNLDVSVLEGNYVTWMTNEAY